jgi:copper homeostasis protein
MNKQGVLEVCAFHIDSCITAEKGGAYRVELCDNPIEGGTTPSYGTIRRTRERIGIRLYPILRPRSGNYCYSEEEFAILEQDVRMCRELGCDGISVGVQTLDGKIDKERLSRVVEWAGPMGVTCNRVFDCAPDAFAALEDVIACGCERILTSGLKSAAPDAAELLGQLVRQAGNRITIMPGAGVKSSNLAQLMKVSGAVEFHSSARVAAPNPMQFINTAVSDYGHVYIADEAEVRAMVAIVKAGS